MIKHFCKTALIDKKRYYIDYKGHTWEVDEFYGNNKGLIVAEIELENEDEKFHVPEWAIAEVTSDERYFNMNLATNPFKDWK